MQNFEGVIIEESLEDKSVLSQMKILSTKVSPVNETHKTPWVKQWTLHTVEIEADQADTIALEISKVIDISHKSSWYADFKNETTHYIIFRDKVFKIDRKSEEQYNEATSYGISLGIPEYQVYFVKSYLIKK